MQPAIRTKSSKFHNHPLTVGDDAGRKLEVRVMDEAPEDDGRAWYIVGPGRSGEVRLLAGRGGGVHIPVMEYGVGGVANPDSSW
jgi:hypothetical protein